MKSLTDFLDDYAAKHRGDRAEMGRRREEWIQAVNRLMTQVEDWLRQADTHGVLEIRRQPREFFDENLGRYVVDGLAIFLDDKRRVEIMPKGRVVVGTIEESGSPPKPIQGLVYISDAGGIHSRLYRLVDEHGDRWVLRGGPDESTTALDRATFDKVMVGLLQ